MATTSTAAVQEGVAEGVSYVPVVGGILSAAVRYIPSIASAIGIGGETVQYKNKQDEARSKQLLACAKAGDYGAVRIIVTEATWPNANTHTRRPERIGLYQNAMAALAAVMPTVVAQAKKDGPVGRALPGDRGDYGDAKKCPKDTPAGVNGAPATPLVYSPTLSAASADSSTSPTAGFSAPLPSFQLTGIGGASPTMFVVGGLLAIGAVVFLARRH